MSPHPLVAAPIVDQTTSTSRTRSIAAELHKLERPSGARLFVRVRIEDDNESPPRRTLDLEPEQARRFAEVLEHGADLADREPVKLLRALVADLLSAGEHTTTMEAANAWLKRHDPQ